MKAYETSATVEAGGQVHLAGVPFAPGTQVEVIISSKVDGVQTPDTLVADRSADPGLGWEGNVLVHQGVGAGLSVAEVRAERSHRLDEGATPGSRAALASTTPPSPGDRGRPPTSPRPGTSAPASTATSPRSG
jgi:hypothetical protein